MHTARKLIEVRAEWGMSFIPSSSDALTFRIRDCNQPTEAAVSAARERLQTFAEARMRLISAASLTVIVS